MVPAAMSLYPLRLETRLSPLAPTRLSSLAPHGGRLDVLLLQLQASADAAAALEQDPTVPPHLTPHVRAFAAALQVAREQLQRGR